MVSDIWFMISGGKINNGYAIVTEIVTIFRHVDVTFVLESNFFVTISFHFCLAPGVSLAWLWTVYSLRKRDVIETCKRHVFRFHKRGHQMFMNIALEILQFIAQLIEILSFMLLHLKHLKSPACQNHLFNWNKF